MGNLSRKTWQDYYWDGKLDERNEVFCEEDQTIHKRLSDDGWDTYKNVRKELDFEDDCSWELMMLSGKVKRIR